jgi:predicted PurR-regulated permease PerM
VGVVFAVFLLSWLVSQALLVVFGAILFAVALNIPVQFLVKRLRLCRVVGLIVVLAALLALTAAALWLVGPTVDRQLAELVDRLPEDVAHVRTVLNETRWGRVLLEQVPEVEDLITPLGRMLRPVWEGLIYLALMSFIGIYLAAQPRLYVEGLLHLFPKTTRPRAREVVSALRRALHWWLMGRIVSMTAVGSLTIIGLWILDMPLVLALGLIAGLMSFVPYIGPILSAIPAVLIALVQGPWQAFYVLVLYATIQFIEGNFVTPIAQQRAVSLPPAALLTAQIFLGILSGFIGLFLATPITVVLMVLVQMIYVQDLLGDDVRVLGAK